MTKKLLVAYNDKTNEPVNGDFLVPVGEAGVVRLFGLKSHKYADKGLIVYVGKEVTADDLMQKLTEAGCEVSDKHQIYTKIEAYLSMLQSKKIGNIVKLRASTTESSKFVLSTVQERPPARSRRLP